MIHQGDIRDIAPTLPTGSVNCIVTSPPYFGLRDYGADNQIGLEQTPDAYVAELVGVFRELRRVLRDDGTLWLNLGDSYSTGGSGQNFDPASGATNNGGQRPAGGFGHRKQPPVKDMPPKNLIGIPWRVALALQADGWYLRSDIIWAKPNPMPESVTDRPTKAHEYIFFLSKSEQYYYDAKAIAEPAAYDGRQDTVLKGNNKGTPNGQTPNTILEKGGERWPNRDSDGTPLRNKRTVWTVATRSYKEAHFAVFPPDLIEPCILAGCPVGGVVLDPFFGSGTVAQVAIKTGRRWIGVELNPDYIDLARQRIAAAQPALLASVGNTAVEALARPRQLSLLTEASNVDA